MTDKKSVLEVTPDWYPQPHFQIERMCQKNRDHDLGFKEKNIQAMADNPVIAKFKQRTRNEVLMLNAKLPHKGSKKGVHRSSNKLWKATDVPEGFIKSHSELLVPASEKIRLLPGYSHTPGLSWIGFDPNAYAGESPLFAQNQEQADNCRLGGTEVLNGTMMFPDWVASWDGVKWLYPNISALQVRFGSGWSRVPYLDRWDGSRKVILIGSWADFAGDDWGSSRVRELEN